MAVRKLVGRERVARSKGRRVRRRTRFSALVPVLVKTVLFGCGYYGVSTLVDLMPMLGALAPLAVIACIVMAMHIWSED